MRPLFILPALFLFLFVSSPADVLAQKFDAEGSQLIEAPFTGTPPVIDGILSSGEWSQAESNTVDYVNLGVAGNAGPGAVDNTDDMSYTFSVMYDDQFLYIAVSVKDDAYVRTNYGRVLQYDWPVAWENDAVEYFFDGDKSRTETTSRNDIESETGGQWIFVYDAEDSPLPFVSAEIFGLFSRPYGIGANDAWYAKTTSDAATNDWSQEARFALSIIGSPKAGTDIGFDLCVDDVETYDPATLDPNQALMELREIQLYWTVYGYEPGTQTQENTHENESLWGTLRFLQKTSLSDWALY
ncbi:MAG: sugar-binding protein [bacterium]